MAGLFILSTGARAQDVTDSRRLCRSDATASVAAGDVDGDGLLDIVEANNSGPEAFRQALESSPMGRMGEPEEVARTVAFLASPAASFVSGTNLLVDGALTRGVQM